MEFAGYFPSLERLDEIDEALYPIDPEAVTAKLRTILFANDSSADDTSLHEYYGNLLALARLAKCMGAEGHFSRLYFGQELCEYLIPDVGAVEKAFYHARQLGWQFTYVTGAVTELALGQVKVNLQRLAALAAETEVVVNDWGVLAVIARDFPSLRPVLGRLLVKQMRLARFSARSQPPPTNRAEIDTPAKEIQGQQISALAGLSLGIPAYRAELARLGVARVDLDIAPQGVTLPPDTWGLKVGCYFPWSYVSGGRNCLTASVADPERQHVVLDKPCPGPCRKLNRSSLQPYRPDAIVQRGNSVFVFHADRANPYLDGNYPIDRVVFEPYIPLA